MYSSQMLNLRLLGPWFYMCWAENSPRLCKSWGSWRSWGSWKSWLPLMKQDWFPFRHAEIKPPKINFYNDLSLPCFSHLHGKDDNPTSEKCLEVAPPGREGTAKCYAVHGDEQCPLYCAQCQRLDHFSPTSAFLPNLHFCLLCLSQSFSHLCLLQHVYRRFHNNLRFIYFFRPAQLY